MQKVLLRPLGRRPLRLLSLPLALLPPPYDVRLHPRAQLAAEHGGAPHWRRAPAKEGSETRVLRPRGDPLVGLAGWSSMRDRCGNGWIPTTVISRRCCSLKRKLHNLDCVIRSVLRTHVCSENAYNNLSVSLECELRSSSLLERNDEWMREHV